MGYHLCYSPWNRWVLHERDHGTSPLGALGPSTIRLVLLSWWLSVAPPLCTRRNSRVAQSPNANSRVTDTPPQNPISSVKRQQTTGSSLRYIHQKPKLFTAYLHQMPTILMSLAYLIVFGHMVLSYVVPGLCYLLLSQLCEESTITFSPFIIISM